MTTNTFLCLVAKSEADVASVEQIAKDLHRTFPNNRHFRCSIDGASMRHQLELLLRALAARFPTMGYCQGVNYVSAMLLLITGEAETAFSIVDISMRHVKGYYAHDMHALVVDMWVLEELLKYVSVLEEGALD